MTEAERLDAAVQMVDGILDLVSTHAPASVTSRDRNDQFLVLAFGRATRCLRSSRDIAAIHAEADDISVLTRALTVTVLLAAWLATPDDPDERLMRGRIVELTSLRSLRTQARSMEALGMEFGALSTDFDARITELEALGAVRKSDEAIASELGLDEVYAHVYRSTSHVAHYSLLTALQGFDVPDTERPIDAFDGLRIRFLDGDVGGAEEALVMAALVYVALLERSEPVLHHGVFESSKVLLEKHVARRSDG